MSGKTQLLAQCQSSSVSRNSIFVRVPFATVGPNATLNNNSRRLLHASYSDLWHFLADQLAFQMVRFDCGRSRLHFYWFFSLSPFPLLPKCGAMEWRSKCLCALEIYLRLLPSGVGRWRSSRIGITGALGGGVGVGAEPKVWTEFRFSFRFCLPSSSSWWPGTINLTGSVSHELLNAHAWKTQNASSGWERMGRWSSPSLGLHASYVAVCQLQHPQTTCHFIYPKHWSFNKYSCVIDLASLTTVYCTRSNLKLVDFYRYF